VFCKAEVDQNFNDHDFNEFFDSIDVTKDGKISKSEMSHYFMKMG